ncbi:MAG: permease [Candidatus Bathyarchaeota archaeon]|nr:MAG: permease [Candidatus Bathyarchaeota archaeon]
MKSKILYILADSLKEMKTIVPAFFIATLIGVTLEFYLPSEIAFVVLGENPFLSIPLATVIGIILPIPRYATYPIAFSLFKKGASIGTIFALISGEVILGSPDRDIMELKYFGWKAFLTRLALCTAFVVLGGLVAEALL